MDDETDHPARSGKVRLKSTRSRHTPYSRSNRKYFNDKEESKERVSFVYHYSKLKPSEHTFF